MQLYEIVDYSGGKRKDTVFAIIKPTMNFQNSSILEFPIWRDKFLAEIIFEISLHRLLWEMTEL